MKLITVHSHRIAGKGKSHPQFSKYMILEMDEFIVKCWWSPFVKAPMKTLADLRSYCSSDITIKQRCGKVTKLKQKSILSMFKQITAFVYIFAQQHAKSNKLAIKPGNLISVQSTDRERERPWGYINGFRPALPNSQRCRVTWPALVYRPNSFLRP